MNDKISVLMTVYKETEHELRESFESIINQTYSNLEIIIIIDNPREKWREDFINSYNDKRVKLFVNKNNIGLPLSLNKALKHVTGDYIARMDADDVSSLDRFEKQIKYIKDNNVDMIGSFMMYFYNDTDQQATVYPCKPKNVRKLLKYKSCVLHPTWLAKPEVFKKNKGYRNIFAVEDYDFLLRASINGFAIGNYPEILYRCRLSENSISRSNPGRQELVAIFLRKKYKKNIIPSEEDINNYINSKKFKRKLKSYNFYCGMKDKRARYRAHKFPMFYIYSILLVLNFRHSIVEMYKKMYNKYILYIDKKN